MTNKTIKELAEEFRVSKQAIRKKLSPDFRANYVQTITSNGVETLVITHEGYLLLKQHFSSGNNTRNQPETVASNTANLTIEIMHEQLLAKDAQIEQMQKLLDQQQQLTLQSNKQIELLQKKLTRLEEPSQEMPEGSAEEKTSLSLNENRGFWRRLFKF